MMDNLKDQIKKWLVAFTTVLALGGTMLLLALMGYWLNKQPPNQSIQLPLLAIAGVVALLASLTFASLAFSVVDLSDKNQALGLPEGSIRAAIAISLVVLFAIISVYLYSSLASTEVKSLGNLTKDQKEEFVKNTPSAQVALVTDTGTGAEQRFTIYYRDVPNQAGQDFAKQLLGIIGTLVTAVSSFYFGARTASAAGSSADAAAVPTLKSAQQSAGARGSVVELQIVGTNLQLVDKVRIEQGANQIAASDVTSSAATVKCKLQLSANIPTGAWDVVVTDSSNRSARLQGVFSVT